MKNKLMLAIFILLETIVAGQRTFQTHKIFWRFGAWTEFLGGAYHGQFQIDDDITFIYPPGEHNVIEVDKEGFDNCVVPPSAKVLSSGQDNIKLDAPGTRWFICGIEQHCKEHGMKIQIDVSPPHDFKNFDVGSEKGWTTNVDYQAWAAGEIFDVGDKLAFNYEKGKHNVIKVDESAYKQCTIPPDQKEALTSGKDEVILEAPGGIGFISGIGKDCENGMKLFIKVKDSDKKPKPSELQGGRKLVPAG